MGLYYSMFYHVLQVGKSSPNIPQIIHWISPWPWIPVSDHSEEHTVEKRQRESRSEKWLNTGYKPVFDLVSALHNINVHTDLEFNMRRHLGGPGVHVNKYQPCPKLALPKKVQCSIGQLVFIRNGGELVQD